MFRITALPALHGDSLWIEWGDDTNPVVAVFDTGPPGSTCVLRQKLDALRDAGRKVRLLVISHIDLDHIGGLLEMVTSGLKLDIFEEIWFNGRTQLAEASFEKFGFKEGDELAELLTGNKSWNASFGGHLVSVPDDGALPTREIEGMHFTVLSPDAKKSAELSREWDAAVAAEQSVVPTGETKLTGAGLKFETFGPKKASAAAATPLDRSTTNGSSIALHLRLGESTAVLSGDAHAGVLVHSLGRLVPPQSGPYDLVQLPHHGSAANVSKKFLRSAPALNYLASTDGTRHDHPNIASLERMLVCEECKGSTIWFNYTKIAHVDAWFAKQAGDHLRREDGIPQEGAVIRLS